MSEELQVIFQPSGRRVFVLPGTIVLEAAARAGFIIDTPCGGTGKCGKCLVRITAGDCETSQTEKDSLGSDRIAKGWRLACQARIVGPLTIEIPGTSLFESSQRILETGKGEKVDLNPNTRKQCVELATDASVDQDLLAKAFGVLTCGPQVSRRLPGIQGGKGTKVTGVFVGGELVDVEMGDTAKDCYGLAFDIGTTTIVGTLVDLGTGDDVAVASRLNPQTSFGDDVISRITRCRDTDDGLAELQESVLGAVREICEEVAKTSGVASEFIYACVFAGNSTMGQILCGIDPSPLGEMPFVSASTASVWMTAIDLGLNVNPVATAYTLPQIGSFIGGDTVAGVVACRLDSHSDPALLVDIGTNGELVLAANGKMTATSVAAGPAFEGTRITNGMRATAGAIEKVVVADDVELNVIGNTAARGICGTGLVDAVAGLLRVGVLEVSGRILSPDELPSGLSLALRERVVEMDGQSSFELVRAEDSASGEALRLLQRDIREVQLANGGLRAGASILLRMAGLDTSDLGAVLVAGAFGNFIRRGNARRMGLLPAIPSSRIRYIGNVASSGAKAILLSIEERERAEAAAAKISHIDLSLDPEFQMEFGSAMIFPGPEVDACE